MDMSNFRPEFHVAQRSRRDKLRIFQHASNSNPAPLHHLGAYNMNHMNQLPAAAGSICYDPTGFCPEIANFSEKPENYPTTTTNNFHHPSDTVINRDPHELYFSTWKGMGSQPTTTDNCWVPANNQTPNNFVGEGPSCSSSFKIINSDNLGYQELHTPLGNNHQSSEISSQKHYGDHMHSSSSPFYQNALQELVSTSSVRSFVPMSSLRQKSSEETSHGPWVDNGCELLLLPAYGDQTGLKGPDNLISRPAGGHQWNGELDFAAAKENSHTQALSLSLSSVPSPKVHATQIAERDNAVDLQSRDVFGSNNVQDFRIQNLPTGGKILGNASMGTQALSTHRNPGPLGPFTGYETILRSSRFLRPAQILLEELSCFARPKNDEICEGLDKILEEVRVSGEGVSNGEPCMKEIGGDSSFGFNGSNDKSPETTGTASVWMDSYRPENFQKKAKLLYMQDEVCKKYKQYHQQMQMVVSSFESVAGLSAATPYVSLALKMASKHFRCLKNAITDQLKSIRNALGEEYISSPTAAGTSSSNSKGDASGSMLKFFDRSLQKQQGASNNLGNIFESQHIWRPQRGLPERAVSILRAWLFDHFLHPYPTDTDKHMLASQTGLTRNQVSNWFINARVRVWKPMVEEIHILETKGMAADTGSADGKATTSADRGGQANDTVQCSNTSDYSSHDVDTSEHEPDRWNPISTWNQEKRSRIDYHHVPTSTVIEGPLMRFVPSHQTVSLTLGLRQSAENGQRAVCYGGQILRDFVG